jgi:hypothetical protein
VISKPCREAAAYLVAVDISYDYITDHDLEIAAEKRAECKGGTWCDSAHQIPTWVEARRPPSD